MHVRMRRMCECECMRAVCEGARVYVRELCVRECEKRRHARRAKVRVLGNCAGRIKQSECVVCG